MVDRPMPGQSRTIVRDTPARRSSVAPQISTLTPRPLSRSSGNPSPRSRTNSSTPWVATVVSLVVACPVKASRLLRRPRATGVGRDPSYLSCVICRFRYSVSPGQYEPKATMPTRAARRPQRPWRPGAFVPRAPPLRLDESGRLGLRRLLERRGGRLDDVVRELALRVEQLLREVERVVDDGVGLGQVLEPGDRRQRAG